MELADRGHAAMVERYRLGAELDGGEVLETADGLIYAYRGDFLTLNGAVPVTGGDPTRLLADTRSFFAVRGRGFTLMARSAQEDEAAHDAGMHVLIERYPAMVLREPVSVPEGLRAVTDA